MVLALVLEIARVEVLGMKQTRNLHPNIQARLDAERVTTMTDTIDNSVQAAPVTIDLSTVDIDTLCGELLRRSNEHQEEEVIKGLGMFSLDILADAMKEAAVCEAAGAARAKVIQELASGTSGANFFTMLQGVLRAPSPAAPPSDPSRKRVKLDGQSQPDWIIANWNADRSMEDWAKLANAASKDPADYVFSPRAGSSFYAAIQKRTGELKKVAATVVAAAAPVAAAPVAAAAPTAPYTGKKK